MPDHKGKFTLTYKGLYAVKKAFSGGAIIIANMDGHDFNMPTNFDAVIQFFAWGILQVRPLFLHSYVNIKKILKKIKNKKKATKKESKKYKNTKTYEKVNWKPKRAVYEKGEQKQDRERAC